MRSPDEVREVFRLAAEGCNQSEIARRLGVARATVRDWLVHGEVAVLDRPMRVVASRRDEERVRCLDHCKFSANVNKPAFGYLLGQYLGDGCVSPIGSSFRLRIACCDDYPGIMNECRTAMGKVVPGANVRAVSRQGYTEVYATWRHWPCLLPHGPGPKHKRRIVLEPWQREIALDRHPHQLLRGLIHSDGCRCTNRVRRSGRTYSYMRYFFSNLSVDIQALFLEACQQVGVEARPNNANSISVARRASVQRLDQFVGPKV